MSQDVMAGELLDLTDRVKQAKGGRHRHSWSSWLLALAILTVVAGVAYGFVTTDNIRYDVVAEFLFSGKILHGLVITVSITLISMILAIVLGVPLALMRLSKNPILKALAAAYIWFFRGTPLLVQIIFWGYIGLIFPQVHLGIPFTDIVLLDAPTTVLVPVFVAGVLALFFNEAAYTAEIVRSGILSVDSGQREAGAALGMTHQYLTRRIVLPQAMRVMIPPLTNNLIVMLKSTALLSLIAVPELYNEATSISAQNLAQVELLLVAAIWYLVVVSILYIPQRQLEKHFGKGF